MRIALLSVKYMKLLEEVDFGSRRGLNGIELLKSSLESKCLGQYNFFFKMRDRQKCAKLPLYPS